MCYQLEINILYVITRIQGTKPKIKDLCSTDIPEIAQFCSKTATYIEIHSVLTIVLTRPTFYTPLTMGYSSQSSNGNKGLARWVYSSCRASAHVNPGVFTRIMDGQTGA